MELEPFQQKKEDLPQNSPLRQLIIAPEWIKGGDRLILVCVAPNDMTMIREEAIRLNIDDFPTIGIVKPDGSVDINSEFCLNSGIYNNLADLAEDLQMLLGNSLKD